MGFILGVLAPVLVLGLPAGVLAATITVNSVADAVADDGACTFREAIVAANANAASGVTAGECPAGAAGADIVAFNIPGSGVRTITLTSSVLPTITEPLTIDGYTQPGSSANTLVVGDNAVLLIRIDAGALPALQRILQFTGPGANGSSVTGLNVGNANGGVIFFNGVTGGSVTGNFLGTDSTGSTSQSNVTAVIELTSSSGITIGGTTPAARNVMPATAGVGSGTIVISNGGGNTIQGNYVGVTAAGTAAMQAGPGTDAIDLFATTNNVIGGVRQVGGNVILGTDRGIFIGAASNNTTIQGNLIGTNAAGTAGLGGGTGIDTNNAPLNGVIGGAAPGLGNVISGGTTGINLIDGANNFNIKGNRIGTDIAGASAIPNTGNGISILTTSGGTVIGGTGPGDGNIIAFNQGHGIGFGFSTAFTGYAIRGNSIFGNGGLGITLGLGSPAPNDAGDPDAGPNNLQNFPAVTQATVNGTLITLGGTLNSTPFTTFAIDFFSSPACDASGNGEGKTYLGSTSAITNASGDATIAPLDYLNTPGEPIITATATDPAGNTSEFSQCLNSGGVTTPSVSIGSVSQNEGNSGTTAFTFTVTLSAASASTVTVNFATADGTATAGSDYAATSGTVTFNPGVTTQPVTVNVNGDATVEPNETFTVNLSSPSGATIAGGTGTGTIVNDDAAGVPSLSINNVSHSEGNSGTTPFTFTVTLSAPSASTVTVAFATADGTATAGSDYAARSGALSFAPGATTQTVTVDVTGDTTPETTETFLVNLSAASNATIGSGSGTGTIVDDDAAPPAASVIIPTLGQWSLVLLALALAVAAAVQLRRRRG
jgi:CSLREA domain-containing protein